MNDADRARVQAALDAGRKIEAIKIYREVTGVGLKQAKQAVDGMKAAEQRSVWNEVDLTKVQAALDDGSLIEAIKHFREATGVGLEEAKYAVEAMADGKWSGRVEPPRPVRSSPPSRGHAAVETSSGCGSVVLVGVGLVLWVVLL